ncbi:MAG: ABC transporter ATP-binding protein [Halobacteriaceae archaeon]
MPSHTLAKSSPNEPAVSVQGLRKRYGDVSNGVIAVDDVSFSIDPGTAVGLLGPNGAGKTTTIKSLLGLIEPTAGKAMVNGIDVHANPSTAYRHIGAILEGARNVYWRLTVRENLRFFAALGGQRPESLTERHNELLQQLNLTDKADTQVRDLSRGMKQKVTIACTLAREADVVFLDEPTLGLDVESSIELRRELRRLVNDESITVLLSSHDMDVIEDVCNRVIIMNDGHIVADDTVDNLLSLFRTQTYEITTTSYLADSDRTQLQQTFNAENFTQIGDQERFQVQVTGDEFYDLIDILEANDYIIDNFESIEPDLEDVFLHVTRTEQTQSDAASSMSVTNQ